MTTPATAPESAPTSTAPTSTATPRPQHPARRWLRRWGPWLLLALAAATLATLLSGSPTGEPLGPDNPGRDGAQALARVLEREGVEVQVVNGTRALLDRDLGPGTTVLLPHTAYLGPEHGTELVAHLADVDRLVVLVQDARERPGDVLGIDVDVQRDPADGARTVADCSDPLVREGDLLARRDVRLDAGGPDRATVTACYPPTVGHGAGGARAGALLSFPADATRPLVTLVGFSSALTNEHVTEEAHAALGLRLLGGSERLVWVVPQPGDADPGEGGASLWSLLPSNLTAIVTLLGATVLALALVQGRRLGPVVVEPLPAVVRAAETTRSRGRLYRQARDREHALAALRDGTAARLAPRLGLPGTVGRDELAQAVAAASDRPAAEVADLLIHAGAVDDAALLTIARQLRALEEGLHA